MIILVFLSDRLLIQKPALKISFQEQGCPRFGRFSNNQLKGQLSESVFFSVNALGHSISRSV